MRLENKIALITGASGNIGLAAAELFLNEGANVFLADLNTDLAADVLSKWGDSRVAISSVDVTSEDDMARMTSECVSKFGGIDVFLANAGIEGKIGSIADSDVSNFDRVMAVNVRGVWLGLHNVIPVMKRAGSGSIIITSSGAGVKGAPNLTPYNTSKHAVIGLMRCAALECAPLGIRVNTVNPGAIDSRMMSSIAEGMAPGASDVFHEAITQQTPVGRYGLPSEVANMMLFLASDEASFCTGSVYMVDGGNAT